MVSFKLKECCCGLTSIYMELTYLLKLYCPNNFGHIVTSFLHCSMLLDDLNCMKVEKQPFERFLFAHLVTMNNAQSIILL